MIRLLKYLRKRDWLMVVIIIGLTLLQVYCTMTLMDYISSITASIQYLYYHNNPMVLFNKIAEGGKISADMLSMMGTDPTTQAFSWTTFMTNLNVIAASNPSMSSMVTTFDSIGSATTGDIWFNGEMMVLVALGMVACQAVISVFASLVSASVSTQIRKALNDKITSFSLAEINHFSTASLITRTTNDVQMYQMTILLALRMFFAAPVTAIWAICKVQAISWTLMLPTLIGVIALVIGLVLMMVIVMPKFRLAQKLLDKVNGQTRENVTGIRVVHAYNAVGYQKKKFAKTNDELTKTQLFTGRAMALISPYITIIMNAISVVVYWIGSSLINDGTTSYAEVLSMMMLSTQIVMAFMMLLMMFVMIPRANVSAKRINEVLSTESSINDPAVEEERHEQGSVEFRNVSFKYPDGDDNIISDISFSARQGETIAFIGATGSGKSTLVNLVARLYDATSGEVLIDGVNVKNLKQSTLRHLIGFVPQKGLLFSGNVKDNIAFGNPDLSMDEVERAARIAEADSFIQEMDKKYDAPIAQGGSNVSGGQRQRLCIARAVAMHPEFYVFDDSFSALDFKTDKKVRDNLRTEEKSATKLIVAQRIGTIMDADHIVVLSEGKMVGYGTHRELLQNCPTYRDIALSQLSKEELGL